MARVNIKLHYTMGKPKHPMHKVFWGLHLQEKWHDNYWFCDHDKKWHSQDEVNVMMEQGIKFNYSNYDHSITCIRKLKRFIRKNPQFKNCVFFMSHVYLGHSVTVTAKVK